MLQELEDKIGYHFKDKKYLKTALTHSSYANENKKAGPSNERLEFLGDSVLGVVVADYLFKHCPNMPEGDLTKTRASLVLSLIHIWESVVCCFWEIAVIFTAPKHCAPVWVQFFAYRFI